MKIEQQVCSFEQAKRLKELGILQDSIYAYYGGYLREIAYIGCLRCGSVLNGIKPPKKLVEPISAFTVAELGVMLGVGRLCVFTGGFWITEGSFGVGIGIIGKTEAECRASLLIAIIESNGALVPQVNARLSA